MICSFLSFHTHTSSKLVLLQMRTSSKSPILTLITIELHVLKSSIQKIIYRREDQVTVELEERFPNLGRTTLAVEVLNPHFYHLQPHCMNMTHPEDKYQLTTITL